MIDDLLELCRQVEPALLMFDPYLFAGPLVAGRQQGPAQSSIPLAADDRLRPGPRG